MKKELRIQCTMLIGLLFLPMFSVLAQKVQAFSNPYIVNVGISYEDYSVPRFSPITQTPGGIMRLWYRLYNPNSYSVDVILGASIKIDGSIYSDPTHDAKVTLQPGDSNVWYSRWFYIPSSVPSGTYDVIFAIWSPDWSTQYDSETKSGWVNMINSAIITLSSSPTNIGGTVTWDGVIYSLPITIYTTTRIHYIYANPPIDYEVDNWIYSGDLSIYIPFTPADVVHVLVHGHGSLAVVFKKSGLPPQPPPPPPPPSLPSLSVSTSIVSPPVLGGTISLKIKLRNTGTVPIDAGKYTITISFLDYYQKGGLDSFWVWWDGRQKGSAVSQLGTFQTKQVDVPKLDVGGEFDTQVLTFDVPSGQSPSLALADTLRVQVRGPNVEAQQEVENIDVQLVGGQVMYDVLEETIITILELYAGEYVDIAVAYFEAQIENLEDDLSKTIDAINDNDVPAAARHLCDVAIDLGLPGCPVISEEKRRKIAYDTLVNYLQGPLSIGEAIIWYVNYKAEGGLKGLDLTTESILYWLAKLWPGPGTALLLVTDPANLYLIDPLGRRSGLNPLTGLIVNEIPDAYIYGIDGNVGFIFVPNIVPGPYKLKCFGILNESYILHVEVGNSTFTLLDQVYQGSFEGAQTLNFGITVTETLTGLHVTCVLDYFPPITTLTIGYPKYIAPNDEIYVTCDTPFTLTAEDNVGGSGVHITGYRISNSTYTTGWITSQLPIVFYLTGLTDGPYFIEYNSTDNAGNTEPTNTVTVTLFSWNYIFEDTYGRGTTLKINLAHKFFQFITPDKDYGIRNATYMRQCGRTIIIQHCDGELRLITISVDTKLDFCLAIAWDQQTRKQYFLIDKAGKE